MDIALETPDQPDVHALIAALDAFSDTLSPPEVRHRSDIVVLVQPHVLFAVARDDDRTPLGCAAVALLEGYGEVKRMFVVPAARGRGVASALLGFLEAKARSRGCTCLRLETGNLHALAHRAYRANGFARCGAFGDYPPHELTVFMEKRLD